MPIYLINNHIVAEDAPHFTPNSRGYRYGDGFFESCAMWQGRILQLPLHVDRIKKSALLLKINLPSWWDEISWETERLLGEGEFEEDEYDAAFEAAIDAVAAAKGITLV